MSGIQDLDVDRLNTALDVVLEKNDERAGAYALLHTHGWQATDAVTYARAAQFCIDNGIDPNTQPRMAV